MLRFLTIVTLAILVASCSPGPGAQSYGANGYGSAGGPGGVGSAQGPMPYGDIPGAAPPPGN